jgi:DNA helicase-2/ATP-dependent DNA helicase PcrA
LSFLQHLNQVQQQAVQATEGPVIIVAGAGSGKTRVLTYRAAYLVHNGIPPYEILALTFTNKAANEMKQRIIELVGPQSQYVQMGTFHSVFARLLRRECEPLGFNRNFTIYDTEDSQQAVKTIMKENNISSQQFKPTAIRGRISMAKNQMISPQEFSAQANNFFDEKTAIVFEEYQERLRKMNAMDFDDLLIKPIELFSRFPKVLEKYQQRFKYILVDEYQDTNRVQYVLVKMLAEKFRNVCVVGDDAQSIYSFRGADIRNILDFQKDYPDCQLFRLEQNYRSTKNILNVANEVIKNNTGQIPKNLWTENFEGEKITHLICEDDREEGERIVKKIQTEIHKRKIPLKDVAVLYRTNAQSRSLEDALRKENLPYVIIGGVEFYRRKEIKDVLAYLRTMINPIDEESMLRIINYPARGIGETAVAKIQQYAREHSMPFFEALQMLDAIVGLHARARNALHQFNTMIWKYIEMLEHVSASEVARGIVEEIGILRELKEEGTPESLARWENIQELLSAISEFSDESEEPTLQNFLQEISLVADVDKWDNGKNSITLMTLHAAKGLEFPVVFVSGVEEGLLPLYDSFSNHQEVEEERRLMYVGITRAMQKLYISSANVRYRYGDVTYPTPSRFLSEIEKTFLDEEFFRSKNRERTSPLFSNPQRSTMNNFSQKKNISDDRFLYEQEQPDYENVSQEPKQLRIGMRVAHEVFGKGKILMLSGKGNLARATVQFDLAGTKNLLLQFAHLRIISV